MRVTIQTTVECTIADEFHILNLARDAVEFHKAPEDWDQYYPDSLTSALQLLIRQAVATTLLTCGGVVLHTISHQVTSMELPLQP